MAKKLSVRAAKTQLSQMNLGSEVSICQVMVKKLRLGDGYVYYVIDSDVFTLEQAADIISQASASYAW